MNSDHIFIDKLEIQNFKNTKEQQH
jgi:hypothetical protein